MPRHQSQLNPMKPGMTKKESTHLEISGSQLRQISTIFFLFISFLMEGCSVVRSSPTPTPTETVVPATPTRIPPTSIPILPTPTLLPLFGPVPKDATGTDTVLMQYTKKSADGETLDYFQELGMWMELHSPPNGFPLIDSNIAFYPTAHDLIPVIVEADPALLWDANLLHVDQSNIYWSDRLRLASFSTLMQIELARQAGINLQKKDTQFTISALMDSIYKGTRTIPFRVPGDSTSYAWLPNKGIRVWLVKDSVLDPTQDNSIYLMENGDRLKIFEKQGVLEYIVGTSTLGQNLQKDGILARLLGPMFELLLAPKGKLPPEINSFYGADPKERSPGTLSDMAGESTAEGTKVPGYIITMGR